ncbi:hypothetical protein JHW43_009162 [Diplocarpon mali]|nr:hypothetical protein JHW43_009162 [Diplocarpon mali]
MIRRHRQSYELFSRRRPVSKLEIRKHILQNSCYLDVASSYAQGGFHLVIMSDLAGTYQYFVNKALPTLGKFRTVFRLVNTRLLSGNTSVGKMSRPRRISLRPVPICRMKRASGPRPHSHHLVSTILSP